MPVGGAEDLVASLAGSPSPEMEIHAVCLRSLGTVADEIKKTGSPVHLLPLSSGKRLNIFGIFRLARWLKQERFDVVHSHVYNSHVYAIFAASLAGIPSVIHHHKTFRQSRWNRRVMMNVLNRLAAAHITLSEQTRQDLLDEGNVEESKAFVFSNFVDEKTFFKTDRKTEFRISLGLPVEKPLIGAVASLTPQKNHVSSLSMLERLQEEMPEVCLILCGDGVLRKQLEQTADEKGLSSKVAFMGNQRPIAPWLQSFDLLVLPSSWEGQPMILLQAMACDIPVVASRIEGNSHALGEAHPGLFTLDDTLSYRDKVKACLEDPEFRRKILDHQQQRLAQRENAESYLHRLLRLYRGLKTAK